MSNIVLQQVKFKDDFLEVVSVAGNGAVTNIENNYWVSVKKVCENLNINFETQYKKLKSDPTYEAKLIEIKTNGGVQKVFCIPLEKLNGWLFSINPNKVKPEVKEKLKAYKNECHKVLYNHFVAKVTNHYQIAGFKSQIAQKNKRIAELENMLKQLQPTRYQLDGMGRNNILELCYQSVKLQNDIDTILGALQVAKQNIANFTKALEKADKRAVKYMQDLQNKQISSIESKSLF